RAVSSRRLLLRRHCGLRDGAATSRTWRGSRYCGGPERSEPHVRPTAHRARSPGYAKGITIDSTCCSFAERVTHSEAGPQNVAWPWVASAPWVVAHSLEGDCHSYSRVAGARPPPVATAAFLSLARR